MGVLRVARVTYDHIPLKIGDGERSLGQLVDEYIATTLASGALVSEVSLIFETQEEQTQLARLYQQTHASSVGFKPYRYRK